MADTFLTELNARAAWFNRKLDAFWSVRPQDVPPRLWEAMGYSLRAGGKRLRPVLCQEGGRLAGLAAERIFPLALAFEMVHTASLIHDDLPCMDNDELRRGTPTNHTVYGEGLALLAGDSLLCFAFETAQEGLSAVGIPDGRILEALKIFARALGPTGICGGQVLDSDPASRWDDAAFVESVAQSKTMVLIRAALLAGLALDSRGDSWRSSLDDYGRHLGIAFQVADDLLDATATADQIGKATGKDEAAGKLTFVHALGVDGAKRRLHDETAAAVACLKDLPSAEFLVGLARYLETRTS